MFLKISKLLLKTSMISNQILDKTTLLLDSKLEIFLDFIFLDLNHNKSFSLEILLFLSQIAVKLHHLSKLILLLLLLLPKKELLVNYQFLEPFKAMLNSKKSNLLLVCQESLSILNLSLMLMFLNKETNTTSNTMFSFQELPPQEPMNLFSTLMMLQELVQLVLMLKFHYDYTNNYNKLFQII